MGISRSGISRSGISRAGISTGLISPPSDHFGITVDTTNAGSASDTMIIPLVSGESYDFIINWGDGTIESFTSSVLTNVTHVYSSGGVFDIKITGTFPRIFFNNGGDRLKVLDITNWGNIVWSSMENAFYGCANLTGTYTDSPDLSLVIRCTGMMRACAVFNGLIDPWDVSNVQFLNTVFFGCGMLDKSPSSWDVSSVTALGNAFAFTAMDPDLSSWQIQNCGNFTTWLNSSSLSTANYDLMLNAYSLLSVQSGAAFGVGTTNYTIATSQAARDILTGGANLWTISDGGGV